MMPDDDKVNTGDKTTLAAKLAILLGLLPQGQWSDVKDMADSLLCEDDKKDMHWELVSVNKL